MIVLHFIVAVDVCQRDESETQRPLVQPPQDVGEDVASPNAIY